MNKSTETRLRKLEAASPDRKTRLFIIEGETEAERTAIKAMHVPHGISQYPGGP